MEIDLDAIEKVARAATQGEWELRQIQDAGSYGVFKKKHVGSHELDMLCKMPFQRPENGPFIAAANPAVVLELVARLRASDEMTKKMQSLQKATIDLLQARRRQSEEEILTLYVHTIHKKQMYSAQEFIQLLVMAPRDEFIAKAGRAYDNIQGMIAAQEENHG